MKICELIEHLKTLNPDLPVYYVMFDDEYNIAELTQKDIVVTQLEDKQGKEFDALTFGEGWLL